MSSKITFIKTRDEKSKNLHEQQYIIKFCVKRMVTEMKEMLSSVHTYPIFVIWLHSTCSTSSADGDLMDVEQLLYVECCHRLTQIQDQPHVGLDQRSWKK